MRLEEEFRVKITSAAAEKARTVEGIVNLMWGKLRPRGA